MQDDYTPVVRVVKGNGGPIPAIFRDSSATIGLADSRIVLARQLAAYSRELAGHALEYSRLIEEALMAFAENRECGATVEAAVGMAGALCLTWNDMVVAACLLRSLDKEPAHA